MQYKVTIDYSYDLESEKDHDELLKHLEQELNESTKGIIVSRRQIRLKKIKEVKGKTRLLSLEPQEFLKYVDKDNKAKEFVVDGVTYNIRMDTSRYFVFKNSIECAACGIKGTKIILEINQNDKSPHFNLYAEENGKLVLMTKDHVLPRSKGGKNEMSNYKTLCAICNNLKGNDESLMDEHIKTLRIFYNENKNLPRRQFRELLDEEKLKISKNHVKIIRKGKKEMKKTKGLERMERIKKQSDILFHLMEGVTDEALKTQILNLTKVVDEAMNECNNEVAAHTMIEDTDAGRWNIVSISAAGKSTGFVSIDKGKCVLVNDLKLATEFMSKKDAQRVCDGLGANYSVIGHPNKR